MKQFQSIKKLTVLILIVTAFMSCNDGLTLQTYFVNNELKPGFAAFDIPKSFVKVEDIKLTEQQQKAYSSVDKLNILAFKTEESNKKLYDQELKNIKTILKDSKYQELMRGGSPKDGKFVVKFLGEVDNIEELIIFGNANNKGFLVARILGDDMNASDLISLRTLIDKVNFKDSNIDMLTDFLK